MQQKVDGYYAFKHHVSSRFVYRVQGSVSRVYRDQPLGIT